jgi:hypothetical protein
MGIIEGPAAQRLRIIDSPKRQGLLANVSPKITNQMAITRDFGAGRVPHRPNGFNTTSQQRARTSTCFKCRLAMTRGLFDVILYCAPKPPPLTVTRCMTRRCPL